uniref:Uncharacterized protein n=1 Tax=Anguilla anguilla TaxID=7936 RepID=A0A0E9XW77_ANGAN
MANSGLNLEHNMVRPSSV